MLVPTDRAIAFGAASKLWIYRFGKEIIENSRRPIGKGGGRVVCERVRAERENTEWNGLPSIGNK